MTSKSVGSAADLRTFYEKYYSVSLSSDSDRANHVGRLIRQVGPVDRVLDLGCGDGTHTAVYATSCRSIVGLEVSRKACVAARGRGLPIVCADTQGVRLPFRDGVFDLVVAGELIEHMIDPDHLLDEITRVLGPRGYCVLTTPNLASWYNRLLLLCGFQPYHTDVSLWHQAGKIRKIANVGSGHFMVFTLRALRELLEIHGLQVETVRGAAVEVPLPFPMRAAEGALSKFPQLASVLVVLARKAS